MRKGTLLIFSLMLVLTGCAPMAVLTESFIHIDEDSIRREHDPKTGEIVTSTFLVGNKYVPGFEADLWICDGEITIESDPESLKNPECRQRISSSELFGRTNPPYSCGGRPCSFFP